MQIIANKTGTTNKSEEKDLKQYLLHDSVDYINSINIQHSTSRLQRICGGERRSRFYMYIWLEFFFKFLKRGASVFVA